VSAARILAAIYAACEGAADAESTLAALRELLSSKLAQDEVRARSARWFG
jgi:hypothetical protein